jgi:hypothetical protein
MNAARRESVPALLGVVAEGDVKGRAATVVHVSHGDLKNSLLSRLPVLTTSAQRCSACASSPGPCIPRNNLMGPHSRVREKNWRLQRQIPETSYCLCHGFFFFCFFFSGRRNAQLSKKKKKKKKKKKSGRHAGTAAGGRLAVHDGGGQRPRPFLRRTVRAGAPTKPFTLALALWRTTSDTSLSPSPRPSRRLVGRSRRTRR